MKINRILSLLSLWALSACQPEIKNDLPTEEPGIVVNNSPVNATLTGTVIDENGDPVMGALVKAGNQTKTTDARGQFRFESIGLDKYNSVVKVEMAGYFLGIRSFSAKEGQTAYVRLKLIPRQAAGTFNAATGGTVTLGSSTITLPANAVVLKSNGAAYSGTVTVFAANIDPTRSDIAQIVPGSFQATDADNYRVILKSYGMMAVELQGAGGEPLQIATGKKAGLKMAIPTSLTGTAPTSIPLWYVNETDGLWKEEGSATRNGNFYEGEVAHFSFWNCDIANNAVFLEMTLQTNEGALPFTLVRITRLSNGSYTHGYTDSTGYVSGFVFNGEPLKLEVMDNCNQAIYTQNIGPFTSATNLGNITVTIPPVNTVNISGTAENCSAQPVANGRAFIYFEGTTHIRPVVNGAFSLVLTRCSSSSGTVEITVEDLATQQQSAPTSGSVVSGTYNGGTITACGVSTESVISYTIDGANTFSFNTATATDSVFSSGSGAQNFTRVMAFKTNQPNINIDFSFSGAAVGSFPVAFYSINQYDSIERVTPLNVTITDYGAPGQFIEGSFTGQFRELSNGALHGIACTFRVRRY